MKNEEAIIYLTEAHNNLFQHIPYNDNYHNAIDLAINALKFIDENYPKTFIDYLNGEQICGKAVRNDVR